MNSEVITRTMPEALAGLRLDKALSELFPEYSRGRLQRWLKEGVILVNGRSPRARDKTRGGESIELVRPEEAEDEGFTPEPVPLNVVYEDDALLVVDKPAGLVVHPAVGNWTGTLLNGLLHRYPRIADVPRAGIVHRLDKETSGLMVVAKTLEAHHFLVASLQQREISREYLALVEGCFVSGGTVAEPIGRHPVDRKKMAVVRNGKHAVTHYRIRQRYLAHTLLDVKLETGRTHQIRVHMAHIRHPIVGDPVYAGRKRIPKGLDDETMATLAGFPRQALHARRLGLEHPVTHTEMVWEAPVPEDFQTLLDELEPWKQ